MNDRSGGLDESTNRIKIRWKVGSRIPIKEWLPLSKWSRAMCVYVCVRILMWNNLVPVMVFAQLTMNTCKLDGNCSRYVINVTITSLIILITQNLCPSSSAA